MPSPAVTSQPGGLWTRIGQPPLMEAMHSHHDLELNLVVEGELRYLFAGRELVVRAGQIALFWALPPHGLVESRPGKACWLHVPLPIALTWDLTEGEVARLLQPRPLLVDSAGLHAHLRGRIEQWHDDLDDPRRRAIALVEMQAAVRRLLLEAVPVVPAGSGTATSRAQGSSSLVTDLAQFVMRHHRRPLSVDEIAAAAHLSPSHAAATFRRTVGVTLGAYLTMCRVAEAQRLLVTTDLPVAEIAHASGFGSLSSFHAQLRRATGLSPREFRRRSAVAGAPVTGSR
ncbi:helix-turn-helix domain-containing protein [Aestuariimicrobium soli]|uniref:helix-turn-helix domain-containing protein n=1 Tax=Aestuariimicrobium soli TaxID=2035834 RepID=UPI003EB80994